MDYKDVDYSKIFLQTDHKGYKFTYAMEKFRIKTPKLTIPFGIELYNKREIINFQVNKDTNDGYNFINFLTTFGKLYEQFSVPLYDEQKENYPKIIFPKDYAKSVSHLTFNRLYKNNLIRTHTNKKIKIYTNKNGKLESVKKEGIKGKDCICELEISNIWIYGKGYGITILVNEIEIL